MTEPSPLWLIGTGRCGTSLLLRMLGNHPDLAWMSHWTAWLPGGGRWAALSRVHDLPGLEGWLPRATSRLVPQPTENYRLLSEATDGLFTAPRELSAAEATPDIQRRMRAMVGQHQSAQGRDRFLMKHTGFPRVDFLRAIFPAARFVHVVRDGRAVAASLCQVDWWSGESQWGWGPLDAASREAYAASGYHELVLAGLYWQVLMDRYAAQRAVTPPESLLEVRYDHLVADPIGTLRHICAWADLPWVPSFERRLRAIPMTSDDTRWRRTLSPDEQELLERTLRPALIRHGFLDEHAA